MLSPKIDFFDPVLQKLIRECTEYNWFENRSVAEGWGKAQLEEDGFTPNGTYFVKELFGVFFVFCKEKQMDNQFKVNFLG